MRSDAWYVVSLVQPKLDYIADIEEHGLMVLIGEILKFAATQFSMTH